MNDGTPDDLICMLQRVKANVVENGDNPQYTDYMYGEAKQNYSVSPVSICQSKHQNLPNLETVSAAAAIPLNLTSSCKFEEDNNSVTQEADQVKCWNPFKFDETCFANADNDVSNVGDSYLFPEILVEDLQKHL